MPKRSDRMNDIRQKHAAAERDFDDNVDEGAWYQAFKHVKGQMGWLEWVPESELNSAEAEVLIVKCRELYVAMRLLSEKYVDGWKPGEQEKPQ